MGPQPASIFDVTGTRPTPEEAERYWLIAAQG